MPQIQQILFIKQDAHSCHIRGKFCCKCKFWCNV